MTHPHRGRGPRAGRRGKGLTVKKSLRQAQLRTLGTGRKTFVTSGGARKGRASVRTGRTGLASILRKKAALKRAPSRQPRGGRRTPVSSSLRSFRRAGGRKTPVSAALKVFKRRGRRITGPTESQAIGRSPRRRTGRRIA